MKTFLSLLIVLVVTLAPAQPLVQDQKLERETIRRAREALAIAKPEQPGRIVGKKFSFSGVAVKIWTADNKLQLLNPWAPETYGSGEDNLDHDLLTGKPAGVNVFCIRF